MLSRRSGHSRTLGERPILPAPLTVLLVFWRELTAGDLFGHFLVSLWRVVAGMLLAILSIQFLSTGLNMLMLNLFPSSAAIFFRQFAWGALLLLVMVLNYYDERRRNRRTSTSD